MDISISGLLIHVEIYTIKWEGHTKGPNIYIFVELKLGDTYK